MLLVAADGCVSRSCSAPILVLTSFFHTSSTPPENEDHVVQRTAERMKFGREEGRDATPAQAEERSATRLQILFCFQAFGC